MRSQEFLTPYAFYGGAEQSIPHFETICPPLAHLYDQDDAQNRWRPLLTSNTRTGRELAAALEKVKVEMAELSNYLEEEVPRMHSSDKEGMGEGRTDFIDIYSPKVNRLC